MEIKWHENIHEKGVLCKIKSTGRIILVEGLKGATVAVQGGLESYPEHLTPLTAAEWWDFAPWHDMESAPLCKIFIVDGYGNVVIGRKYERVCSQFVTCHDNQEIYNPKKWLPLPIGDL